MLTHTQTTNICQNPRLTADCRRIITSVTSSIVKILLIKIIQYSDKTIYSRPKLHKINDELPEEKCENIDNDRLYIKVMI